MNKIFLLSPARCDGRRAQALMNPNAAFALAERLRTHEGAPLGEVFSFLSGLYFRGKLAYSLAFGHRSRSAEHTFVITTDRGLVAPGDRVRHGDLVAFSDVDIGAGDARYSAPLQRDAEKLASELDENTPIVLLGSIATGKYTDALTDIFGDRLLFPADFVGRGDMSRGGLMLRCVREDRELDYVPVIGAVRRGTRPAKLEQLE